MACCVKRKDCWLGHPICRPTWKANRCGRWRLASLAAGARGLWFCSDHPLDAADPATQLRRLLLERLNQELLLVAAWAMGGRRVGEVAAQNPQYRVTALATERSRLLIPCRVLPHAQFVCIPGSDGNSLVVSGAPTPVRSFC